MAGEAATDHRRAAGKICAYCGQRRLDGRQQPEHPIPRVLGSRLTVFTVCNDCNGEAGRQVDAPWLSNFFVQNARAEAGIPDPRHKSNPIKDPFLNGAYKDEDGHTVVAKDGVPHYPGSIVHDGDQISIAAETPERAQELLERLKRQLADEGRSLSDFSQESSSKQRPRLTRRLSMTMSEGVRMGAKLGLAFAAEVYDEDWRESPEAQRLREWLWSDKPTDGEGNTLAWTPASTENHPFADPPHHLTYFDQRPDRAALVVLVFGKLGFTIPLTGNRRLPNVAWRVRLEKPPEQTTLDELLLTEVKRYGQRRLRNRVGPDPR